MAGEVNKVRRPMPKSQVVFLDADTGATVAVGEGVEDVQAAFKSLPAGRYIRRRFTDIPFTVHEELVRSVTIG